MSRSALLLSHSSLIGDSRVRRQIDWLTEAGWTVDTVGFGPSPSGTVRDHFTIEPHRGLSAFAPARALARLILPARAQFRALTLPRIPHVARERAASGAYDLVVFNELDFAMWASWGREVNARWKHLDLHEYHEPKPRRATLAARLLSRQYTASRRSIGSAAFTSRSTVASGIAELYAAEFGIPAPVLVRNCPPFEELSPRPVDSADIRLLFHGMASRVRGLFEIIDAMRVLPENFSMTFMMTPNKDVIDDVVAYAGDQPRIRFVPPVPLAQVASAINEYDLEIIFYRPNSTNYRLSLPNKFFEAVQGRLGVVIGQSPMMAELVDRYGNGVVVPGWTSDDLAATIASLTPERVMALKSAADRAAAELNAENEGRAFLAAATGATS